MLVTPASANTGFYVGLGLGFVVVVVVVVLVAMILTFASRIGDQAHAAADVIGEIRDNTTVLNEIQTTNRHATSILSAMQSAREVLTR
jgi:Sec-independent protein translocase protein TatA